MTAHLAPSTQRRWAPPRLSEPRKVVITPRQADVLAGLCHGLSAYQIGRRLYITEHSVKTHLRRLYAALNVTTSTQAVALAMSGQVDLHVDLRWSTS